MSGISREMIALRVARELLPRQVVNLGIGLPTLVANFIDESLEITFHSENGLLGFGRLPDDETNFDPDYINASGEPITLLPGGCCFDSADSFAMVRGGHIDVAVLGGLQVAANGDLANWQVPGRGGGSIGGAMDIAVGARRLIIAMDHMTKDGHSRLVPTCDYPLTAVGCVDTVVTNLAVIDVRDGQFVVREVAPGVSIDELRESTDAELQLSVELREMQF